MQQGVTDLLFVGKNGVIDGFFTADQNEELFCTGHAGIEEIPLLHDIMLTEHEHDDDFEFAAL